QPGLGFIASGRVPRRAAPGLVRTRRSRLVCIRWAGLRFHVPLGIARHQATFSPSAALADVSQRTEKPLTKPRRTAWAQPCAGPGVFQTSVGSASIRRARARPRRPGTILGPHPETELKGRCSKRTWPKIGPVGPGKRVPARKWHVLRSTYVD